eukprot:UN28700
MIAPSNTFHSVLHAGDNSIVNESATDDFLKTFGKMDTGDNFVSLILATRDYIAKHYPDQKVGLMATKMTYKFGMYENVLSNCFSDEAIQELSIEGIKYVK